MMKNYSKSVIVNFLQTISLFMSMNANNTLKWALGILEVKMKNLEIKFKRKKLMKWSIYMRIITTELFCQLSARKIKLMSKKKRKKFKQKKKLYQKPFPQKAKKWVRKKRKKKQPRLTKRKPQQKNKMRNQVKKQKNKKTNLWLNKKR